MPARLRRSTRRQYQNGGDSPDRAGAGRSLKRAPLLLNGMIFFALRWLPGHVHYRAGIRLRTWHGMTALNRKLQHLGHLSTVAFGDESDRKSNRCTLVKRTTERSKVAEFAPGATIVDKPGLRSSFGT
jgi:hypothetical protein